MDSWLKSEKNVVLEVSKLTKIIVCFQDASAMKKKILISSTVMFSWNQKVIKERYLVAIYSETHMCNNDLSKISDQKQTRGIWGPSKLWTEVQSGGKYIIPYGSGLFGH